MRKLALALIGLALWASGCSRPNISAFLGDQVNPQWLAMQKSLWRTAVAPLGPPSLVLPARAVRTATATGETLVWISQRDASTELWTAPLGRTEERERLLTLEYPDRIAACELSPNGRQVLLLTQNERVGVLADEAELEIWDLPSGARRNVASSVSLHFGASWQGDSHALYAEVSEGSMSVFVEDLKTGGRYLQFAHHAHYARLLSRPLYPRGRVIYDRNDPLNTHMWVRKDDAPSAPWFEGRASGIQARLMGWRGNQLVVVEKSSDETSRVLTIPLSLESLTNGPLDLRGTTVAQTSVMDFVYFWKDSLYYFTPGQVWGHRFFRMDLESGESEEIYIGNGPLQGQTLIPAGDGRALMVLEGLFQLPELKQITPPSRSLTTLISAESQPLSPNDFLVVRDGDTVSIRAAAENDESPVLLETYGGFQQTLLPNFDAARLEWLARGGRVVVALLKAPARGQEQTRDRLLEIAKSLGPHPVVYRGRSFGGTMGLLAMQEDPEAFQAVWADAAVTDLLGFPKIPPGDFWTGELGDPSQEPDSGRLRALSPMHNLSSGRFPPVVLSAAQDDPVVASSYSYRWLEAMQSIDPNGTFLLDLQTVGTHSGMRLSNVEANRVADLLWQWVEKGRGKRNRKKSR